MIPQTAKNILKNILKAAYYFPRKKALKRTADLYSALPIEHRKLAFKSSSTVQKWINKKVSGSEELDFLDYIKGKYLPRTIRVAAALGSHHAHFERAVCKKRIVEQMDCYELSPGAIKIAQELCAEEGVSHLRFIQTDLNNFHFDRPQYDAVFAVKSLHHIENLEGLFENVRHALPRDGYFFIDDFFGPKHLQWTDEQIRLMNEILGLLPAELKTDLGSYRPKTVDRKERLSIEKNIAIDPSEAVRSDEILPVMENYFEIVECINYGGNIYHNLFSRIMGNFRDDHPLSVAIIKLILYIDDLALKSGVFKDSDFKFIIARPK